MVAGPSCPEGPSRPQPSKPACSESHRISAVLLRSGVGVGRVEGALLAATPSLSGHRLRMVRMAGPHGPRLEDCTSSDGKTNCAPWRGYHTCSPRRSHLFPNACANPDSSPDSIERQGAHLDAVGRDGVAAVTNRQPSVQPASEPTQSVRSVQAAERGDSMAGSMAVT